MARKKNPDIVAAEAALQRMTFREKLNDAERLSREFASHLELSFLPQVKSLNKQVRKLKEDADTHFSDISVRDASSQVFAQERFTHAAFQKLNVYLDSINSELQRLSTES